MPCGFTRNIVLDQNVFTRTLVSNGWRHQGGAPAIHRSSLARTLWLHLVPPIFQKPGDEVEQSESQPSADDRRNGKIKIPSATGDWRTSQGHNAIRAAALGWAPINRQTNQEASQEATAMHREWGARQHLNTWEETLHSNDRQVHAWMNHVLEHPWWNTTPVMLVGFFNPWIRVCRIPHKPKS